MRFSELKDGRTIGVENGHITVTGVNPSSRSLSHRRSILWTVRLPKNAINIVKAKISDISIKCTFIKGMYSSSWENVSTAIELEKASVQYTELVYISTCPPFNSLLSPESCPFQLYIHRSPSSFPCILLIHY